MKNILLAFVAVIVILQFIALALVMLAKDHEPRSTPQLNQAPDSGMVRDDKMLHRNLQAKLRT